jgi:hypothetical protein
MSTINLLRKIDQVRNSRGQVVSSGLVYLYEPGTETFITSYKDSALTTPHTNPIKLSGAGRTEVWVTRDCDMFIDDRNGNRVIEQLATNPDSIGAAESGGLLLNGSFEADADADDVPDFWTLTDETGSDNAIDDSESTDGSQCFRFTSTGTGGGSLETTNFFPVNETDDLRINFDIRATDAASHNIVRIKWFDISEVSISNEDIYDSTSNPTSFTEFNLLATPPSGARFAKLELIGIDPDVDSSGSTYF